MEGGVALGGEKKRRGFWLCFFFFCDKIKNLKKKLKLKFLSFWGFQDFWGKNGKMA
jgi:hypothetical protein